MTIAVAAGRKAQTPGFAPRPALRTDGPAGAPIKLPGEAPAQRAIARMRQSLNDGPAARAHAITQRTLNGGVAQFAKLNMRFDGTISGVSAWPHRPPSNVSGKQGQHLTAYVAFEDMILSHVRDRTPKQAANALIDVLRSMQNLPGGTTWYSTYGSTVEINVGLLQTAAKNNDASLVGGVIDNILALRNVMPDTALGTKEKTPGHGEAGTSGGLEVLETLIRQDGGDLPSGYDDKTEGNAALFNMWRLLDFQPSSDASDLEFEKTKARVLRHVMQMRLSYPEVFSWLSKTGAWLMPYLKKNRTDDGMPLSNLSNKEIDQVSDYVHTNL